MPSTLCIEVFHLIVKELLLHVYSQVKGEEIIFFSDFLIFPKPQLGPRAVSFPLYFSDPQMHSLLGVRLGLGADFVWNTNLTEEDPETQTCDVT